MGIWSRTIKAIVVAAGLLSGAAQAGTVWVQQATDLNLYGLVYKLHFEIDGEDHVATRFIQWPGYTGTPFTMLHGTAVMSFTGGLNVTNYIKDNPDCEFSIGYCAVFITNNHRSVPDSAPIKITVGFWDASQQRLKQDTLPTHWRVGPECLIVRYNPARVTRWRLMADGTLRPALNSPKMLYEFRC